MPPTQATPGTPENLGYVPPSRPSDRHPSSGNFVTDCVEEYPESAVAVSLVAGLAVGIGLGVLLAGSDHVRHLRARRSAEGLGERILASLEKTLPQSITDNLKLHR